MMASEAEAAALGAAPEAAFLGLSGWRRQG